MIINLKTKYKANVETVISSNIAVLGMKDKDTGVNVPVSLKCITTLHFTTFFLN